VSGLQKQVGARSSNLNHAIIQQTQIIKLIVAQLQVVYGSPLVGAILKTEDFQGEQLELEGGLEETLEQIVGSTMEIKPRVQIKQ